MEHQGSFLTGFLTGARLKARLSGLGGASDGGANPVSFSQWAANAGADETLSDPDAYARFLSALLFTQVTEDGAFIWRPTFDDVVFHNNTAYIQDIPPSSDMWFSTPPCSRDTFNSSAYGYRLDTGPRSVHVFKHFSRSGWSSLLFGIFGVRYPAPIDGRYTVMDSPFITGPHSVGNVVTTFNYRYTSDFINFGGMAAAGALLGNDNFRVELATDPYADWWYDLTFHFPVFKIIPLENFSVDTENLRPGTLPGSPVSETAKTFTNPITGEIIPFVSFTYDYTTRTYSLTLPDDTSDPENPVPGGSITVTFGNDFLSFTNPDGEEQQAMYLDNGGVPITAPTGAFHKTAFLSGLAAGMAADGGVTPVS